MKSIKFYGETLTITKVSNNILKTLEAANNASTNGLDWYFDANSFGKGLSMNHISRALNGFINHAMINLNDGESMTFKVLSKYHVYGIISALSPLQNWNRNKELTKVFISKIEKGENLENIPYLKGQIRKAARIASLQSSINDTLIEDIKNILKGEKTVSFFLNIAFPSTSNEVTIDRHALSIALGKKLSNQQFQNHSMTKRQYNFFAECYQHAAEKVGLNGLTVQAQTWEFWRVNGVSFQKNLNNLLKLK